MIIANPVYDTVFKYLLDDNKIAVKLLSLILDKNILSLEHRPTEQRNPFEDRVITILHIDFSAVVKLEDGSTQHIIIELQKAREVADHSLQFKEAIQRLSKANGISLEEAAKLLGFKE